MASVLVFRVAYDGSWFSGAQTQKERESVQSAFERALAQISRKELKVQCSSRTDAGVHAYDQCILVKGGLEWLLSLSERRRQSLAHSLSSLLQFRIVVKEIGLLFSASHAVRWKEYRYWILHSSVFDPLARNRAWWVRAPLDLKRLRNEQSAFIGLHDFRSFAKHSAREIQGRPFRRILSVGLRRKVHSGIRGAYWLCLDFRGEGFLHHMVRNMVGTLIELAKGEPGTVSNILKSADRRSAGPLSPPEGLYLQRTSFRRGVYAPLIDSQGAPSKLLKNMLK